MKFKIILLITLCFTSVFLHSCGRKDTPIKPSQAITKN